MQQSSSQHHWLSSGRRTIVVACIVAALFSASAAAYYITVTSPKRHAAEPAQKIEQPATHLPSATTNDLNAPVSDSTPSPSPAKQNVNNNQKLTQITPGKTPVTPGSGLVAPPTPNNPTTPSCPSGLVGTPPHCTTPQPKPLGMTGNWSLIFRDEFTSLNTNVWATQRGEASWSYGDPYNPQYEDAYYLANNPRVTNGNLVLSLTQGASNGYRYSSGMVQNGRNFSYTYGYVEARVKVPGNTGVWPAFWTLAAPIDKYWPPEIDIFEFGLGGYGQTRPAFNYHYGTYPHNQQMHAKLYGNSTTDYTKDYHVYGMLWTSSKIQVFIDGQPGPSYTNAAAITNLPQYIIFNLALQKGATVPNGTAMYVDYIRIWQ